MAVATTQKATAISTDGMTPLHRWRSHQAADVSGRQSRTWVRRALDFWGGLLPNILFATV
jgi:hypothetical protein